MLMLMWRCFDNGREGCDIGGRHSFDVHCALRAAHCDCHGSKPPCDAGHSIRKNAVHRELICCVAESSLIYTHVSRKVTAVPRFQSLSPHGEILDWAHGSGLLERLLPMEIDWSQFRAESPHCDACRIGEPRNTRPGSGGFVSSRSII
jgi:hypothetical protein